MANKLTEKQELLASFFADEESEAHLDFAKARNLAGYSSKTPRRDILSDSLLDELRRIQEEYLVMHGGKAARAYTNILENPSQLGASNKIKAADSILDRAGVVKKSQVEVKQDTPTAIIVIPAKN